MAASLRSPQACLTSPMASPLSLIMRETCKLTTKKYGSLSSLLCFSFVYTDLFRQSQFRRLVRCCTIRAWSSYHGSKNLSTPFVKFVLIFFFGLWYDAVVKLFFALNGAGRITMLIWQVPPTWSTMANGSPGTDQGRQPLVLKGR